MIATVLEELQCHHIQRKNGYFTCGNPDGDNPSAMTDYENENLTVVDYTRQLTTKSSSDLITLVEYFTQQPFFNSVKWICSVIGLDYYSSPEENLPESLRVTKLILGMSMGEDEEEEEIKVHPIPEKILTYYRPWLSKMLYEDGISYEAQIEFEIGYDDETNRITFPIRNELSDLVGVKGRLFSKQLGEHDSKYMYIEPCPRFKILYGLFKTFPYIKRSGMVYVFESEKAVMQCWSAGIYNTVATGGKKVSRNQIEMLTRLCVPICFCFDQDVKKEELTELSEKFIDDTQIWVMYDSNGILEEKESPSDNMDKFHVLDKEKIRIK